MTPRSEQTEDERPSDRARLDDDHSTLRRPSRAPWIILAIAVLAGAAAAYYWWTHQAPPTPPAPVAAAPAPQPEPPAVAPPAPAPVPPATTRSLIESLSSDEQYRKWIADGDLIRRWVVVTDNLAEGVSPRRQLAFLAPDSPFSTVDRPSGTVIAPQSYQRYDLVARVVGSIDAQKAASVYRALRGPLDAAYRALGYPDRRIDGVTKKALLRILAVPVRDGDLEVKRDGKVFVFVDPRLEKLSPVEKHLLRMGPANARIVQEKAREIDAALGLPAPLPRSKRQ